MASSLTPEQEAFKAEYIRARGYWVAFNDGLLQHSPRWLADYLAYADAPQKEGPLDARTRELIYVAVDASTTHMFQQGLEIHVRMALAAGATPRDLIEVLQIATLQGLDSVTAGAAILAEELGADAPGGGDDHDETRPAWLQTVEALAPRYAEALKRLLDTTRSESGLSERERTLVALALAASPTHLNREAMRRETRRALDGGASPAEVLEVFQLVAHLGIHACVGAVPAVVAAAEAG